MARAREPRPASHFRLKLGGHESAGLVREISGLSSATELVEESVTDEQGRPFMRKVPGSTKFGNITIKRGVDNNLDLWKWRKQVIDQGPEAVRLDGTIELLDVDFQPVATYTFRQGWPSKYTGPT